MSNVIALLVHQLPQPNNNLSSPCDLRIPKDTGKESCSNDEEQSTATTDADAYLCDFQGDTYMDFSEHSMSSDDEDGDNEDEDDEGDDTWDYVYEDDDIVFVDEQGDDNNNCFGNLQKQQEQQQPQQPPQPQPQPQTPFWFGTEDADQIRSILACYDAALQLEAIRKASVRQPKVFVGSVHRHLVPTHTSSTSASPQFQTYDTVHVKLLGNVAPWQPLPHYATYYCETTWSIEEGLPISLKVLPSGKAQPKLVCAGSCSTLLACPERFSSLVHYSSSLASSLSSSQPTTDVLHNEIGCDHGPKPTYYTTQFFYPVNDDMLPRNSESTHLI